MWVVRLWTALLMTSGCQMETLDIHVHLSNINWEDGYSSCKAGRARAILMAATIVAAIVAAGARPRTTATVSSHKHWSSYVIDCKDVALACALLLRTRNVKKRKKFWLHPMTSQSLLKGKFYSLYIDLSAHPQIFLDISECLVQNLINSWFCLVQVLHFKIPEWESPCHQKKGWQWH